MTAVLLDSGNLLDNMMPLNANTVELVDAAIAWATQLTKTATRLRSSSNTQTATQADQAWEDFLKAMAIAGFKQWLGEGATPLAVTHMALATDSLDKAISLRVGNYCLCILAMGGLSEDHVKISLDASADALEDAIAHIYVLVEVQEEINQVSIVSGLQRDQLLQRVERERLQQAYRSADPLRVPALYFDVEPEQILLYLNCLEPVGSIAIESVEENARESAEKTESIEQTSFGDGAVKKRRIAAGAGLINTAGWLQDRLDLAVEQLRWELLPPLSMSMRPVRGTVDTVLETLASQGVSLPAAARGVGGPISIGPCICQIYAWVWPVETEARPEWTLLLLLGPQVGEILPEGIQLRVSDRSEVLAHEVLAQSSSEAYLYTQVQGDREEQFRVSVILPDGIEITLPAFGFESMD